MLEIGKYFVCLLYVFLHVGAAIKKYKVSNNKHKNNNNNNKIGVRAGK